MSFHGIIAFALANLYLVTIAEHKAMFKVRHTVINSNLISVWCDFNTITHYMILKACHICLQISTNQ